MRLLLTSAVIATYSTREALVDLLGKPLEESTAIQIPTAIYTLLGSTASANSRNGCVPAPRGPRPTSCSRPSAGGGLHPPGQRLPVPEMRPREGRPAEDALPRPHLRHSLATALAGPAPASSPACSGTGTYAPPSTPTHAHHLATMQEWAVGRLEELFPAALLEGLEVYTKQPQGSP
jgi:hypothetical protein